MGQLSDSGVVNCWQSGYLTQETVGAAGTQTEGVGVGVVVDVDVANVVGGAVVTGALASQSRL